MRGKTPIVLVNGDIIDPKNRIGDIELQNTDQVQFLCSGEKNFLINRTTVGRLATATCNAGKFILHGGLGTYTFNDLKCHQLPQPALQEVQGKLCNRGSKLIHLGFQLDSETWLHKILLCFDPVILTTYWTKHQLRTTQYSCKTADVTTFKKDFFTDVDIDTMYRRSGYDKGHLTPKCDFFSGAEKRMTFYYLNAGPQEKRFNEVNWRLLEAKIRDAPPKGRIVHIYTGTMKTKGFLNSTAHAIPIPLYFWKVVIDDRYGDGVAFVGINDVSNNLSSPCGLSICSELNWLSTVFIRNMSDYRNGKIDCCSVAVLRAIPQIQVPEFTEFRGGVLKEFRN